ncbi:tRNA preQ1(34) S-adenosylmethionine ribosyltransferase-isomerase QueA [Desulfurobacterium indicum]|uniref:S-adenosylmethionine:tRNA ribosyltransferase-isomerase n=1 Tax=Desulfurobacterium indicum TaxID=1914305 RepID=A0A1R1MJF0_9BACT|nr:tRNA preQ1(34) S-adenosylmethionine ribosyltransferase-isomerase QueA [Desulfurobacterium indicum]OMH39893.1 tRNA preQ1(34) S-adenosylmethionine ribosyltransferase-isomerase QueA [Desulfurobacterium indicum]
MKVSLFNYELPKNLIAKFPVEPRDSAKLLLLNRKTGEIEHKIFRDIKNYLKPGDVLVINNTKVIPARLLGKFFTGGKVEIFLTRQIEKDIWEAIGKPGKRLKPGKKVIFDNELSCEILKIEDEGKRIIRFHSPKSTLEKIYEIGHVPLPPYIEREDTEKDKEEYQTVFAKEEGAVAAPTAGLHFTEELLKQLKEKGIIIKEITLHVGLGTFRPVKVNEVEKHKMHYESFKIPQDTAKEIEKAKSEGRRVIAVGTTVVRTLESGFEKGGKVKILEGSTNLFIYPGYNFKVVDAIITNFHLPKSTLLMLVCAFAGREKVLNAYKEAVKHGYRFYSYGDAMFIY